MTTSKPPLPPEEHAHVPELAAYESAFLEQARAGLSPSDEMVRRLRARIDGALPHETTEGGTKSQPPLARYSRRAGTALFGLGLGLGTALGYFWGKHDAATTRLTPPNSSAIAAHTTAGPMAERQTPPNEPASNPSLVDGSTPQGADPVVRPRPKAKRGVNLPKIAAAPGLGTEPGRITSAGAAQAGSTAEADEILMVQRVQRALARKEPGFALALLGELDAQVPKGRLREERAAGRAIAQCMQGSRTNGAFEIFKRQFPTSVHLPRVASACGAQEKTNDTASSDETELPEQE